MIEFWNWRLSGKWYYHNKVLYLNETRFPGLCVSWKEGERGIRVALDAEHIWDSRFVP